MGARPAAAKLAAQAAASWDLLGLAGNMVMFVGATAATAVTAARQAASSPAAASGGLRELQAGLRVSMGAAAAMAGRQQPGSSQQGPWELQTGLCASVGAITAMAVQACQHLPTCFYLTHAAACAVTYRILPLLAWQCGRRTPLHAPELARRGSRTGAHRSCKQRRCLGSSSSLLSLLA